MTGDAVAELEVLRRQRGDAAASTDVSDRVRRIGGEEQARGRGERSGEQFTGSGPLLQRRLIGGLSHDRRTPADAGWRARQATTTGDRVSAR